MPTLSGIHERLVRAIGDGKQGADLHLNDVTATENALHDLQALDLIAWRGDVTGKGRWSLTGQGLAYLRALEESS